MLDSKDQNLLKKVRNFIEELTWVLDSVNKSDLKHILEILSKNISEQKTIKDFGEIYKSPNPNKQFLIGVLPKLFQDTRLFATNESIADFARDVLGLNVSRSEKRSKYELIGLVVCETEALTDAKLDRLVNALSQIVGNDEKLEMFMRNKNKINFDWNRVIKEMMVYGNESGDK